MSEVQSAALALPARVSALLRIYNDLLNHAARLLQRTLRRQRHGRGPSLGECRRIIEEYVVWEPKSSGIPFVAHTPFAATREVVGHTVLQLTSPDGSLRFDKDQKPLTRLGIVRDLVINCRVNLPTGEDGVRHEHLAVPLIIYNGCGGLVPYATVDAQGELLPCAPMLSIFIRDFDPKTMREKDRVRAIPLGLATRENIELWRAIVHRMSTQGGPSWQEIDPIANSLGRTVEYLTFEPEGLPETSGLIPVWNRSENYNPEEPDYWIVSRECGKIATLHRDSRSIIIQGEGTETFVPEQVFFVEEGWTSAELKVWGPAGQIDPASLRELNLEARLDVMALLRATLYDVTPRSGVSLLRNALTEPPLEQMEAFGLILPGSTRELAIETLLGMGKLIRDTLENQVNQARDQLIHELGAGGAQSHGVPLHDALGGEPTPELLQQVHENPSGQNPLVLAIVQSQAARDLGLEVWDSKCWVLMEVFQALLLQLAKTEGLELPLPPDADSQSAGT